MQGRTRTTAGACTGSRSKRRHVFGGRLIQRRPSHSKTIDRDMVMDPVEVAKIGVDVVRCAIAVAAAGAVEAVVHGPRRRPVSGLGRCDLPDGRQQRLHFR